MEKTVHRRVMTALHILASAWCQHDIPIQPRGRFNSESTQLSRPISGTLQTGTMRTTKSRVCLIDALWIPMACAVAANSSCSSLSLDQATGCSERSSGATAAECESCSTIASGDSPSFSSILRAIIWKAGARMFECSASTSMLWIFP